jgi:hypothetical protein
MQRSFLVLGSLAFLAWSPSASAQAQAENVAAARTLGVSGIELADQGKCKEAIEKLERAEALYHAPTILGRLGECQVEVGQVVLGTENLNRVAREQLPANAPPAFVSAQERAKKVLERALPQIAYLTVRVEPQGVAGVQVTVGGTPVPLPLLGAERPTDPGAHEVVATAAGYNPAKTSVTLTAGAHQEVSLVLTADLAAKAPPPVAAAPVAVVTPPPPGSAPMTGPSKKSNVPAYVAFGVGGVGLITGAVTGIMALSKEGSLECPNNHCPPSEHDELDSAETLATVSTISFGVGLAGAAVGVVLLMTGGGSEASPSAKVGPVRAQPWFGARSLGVQGSF